MTGSQNEIATLFRKAAIGAGFPPAQAARFGKAAVRHLGGGGQPGPLMDALATPADSAILRLPLIADDVLRAKAVLDGEIALSINIGDAALVRAYVEAIPLGLAGFALEDGDDTARVILTPGADGPPPLPERIELDDATLTALRDLGRRTEVPASDASRLSGAGAGLTDND